MAVLNPISRIDAPLISLSAVAAPATGGVLSLSQPCRYSSMQVTFTGGSPTVKVILEGTIDGTDYFPLATFDTAVGNLNGDIVQSATVTILGLRARLATLSGGTTPTVSASILGSVQ